jgi:hypothetical protein
MDTGMPRLEIRSITLALLCAAAAGKFGIL